MNKRIIDDIDNVLIKINSLIKDGNIVEYTNREKLNFIKSKLLKWLFISRMITYQVKIKSSFNSINNIDITYLNN